MNEREMASHTLKRNLTIGKERKDEILVLLTIADGLLKT
jgi:hypothetical protein